MKLVNTMLFMHNNRYFPLTGLLTGECTARKKHREIFEIFQKHFTKYFMKYFTPKKFMNIVTDDVTLTDMQLTCDNYQ